MQHQKTLFSTKFISNTLWQVAHFLGKFWSTMRSDVEFKGLKQGFAEWLKAWNSKVNTLEWWELCGLWKDMQLQLIYDLGHHGHESGYHWLPQRPKSTFFCLYQYLFSLFFKKFWFKAGKTTLKLIYYTFSVLSNIVLPTSRKINIFNTSYFQKVLSKFRPPKRRETSHRERFKKNYDHPKKVNIFNRRRLHASWNISMAGKC